MADIGRILYLPPPSAQAGVAGGRANAAASPAGPAGERRSDGNAIAPVTAPETADAGSARAKQFRFRVYDGGRPDEALPGDNGLPSRRAGNIRDDDATASRGSDGADPAAGSTASTGDKATNRSGAAGLTTASAPFLAQLIAQEQLRPGLYDPPLRAADQAYRQAGGDPPLSNGSANPRFQLAV